MMTHQKLNWTLMLFLLPVLILGLAACGGQRESEAPPATTAEEKEVGASGRTEEKVAEETEAEAPAKTEDTTGTGAPEETIEVRQATTVQAATQMIDLHKLPLPDEAELMGQPEPGSLRYQAPIEVAAAVDLCRSTLTDQGWQEDVSAGHVDNASAMLFFEKEDFKLALSASDMGEGKTMVALTNCGNIDLRALPQMADAEDVYDFPTTLSYFSATDVAGVADFTHRELAAQGWHEYTQPNTAVADDPERQSFTLIQNGLELVVSVGAAPAQGGKTAVQYSVGLLPLDLPVADDATGLELDKFLHSLSLSYTTPADFETLFDYYSQEMTALGWVVLDNLGIMTPERATLFFGNENVPPHTLVLDLIPFDGQTLATLRHYDVAELTELTSPGTSSQTEESSPMSGGEMAGIAATEIEANTGDTIEMGDFSFTVTKATSPEDMAYPPQEGYKFLEIVFTVENRHASDTFDSFSSLWLSVEDSDGWSYGYDALGFAEVGASDDSYGSHNGSLGPDEEAQGEVVFQVPVDSGELFLVVEAPELGDDKAFVALPKTETPPTAGSVPDASAASLPNVLVPPDAQDLVYDADYGSISYISPTDMETTVEFYRQSLSAEGWQEDTDFSSVSDTFSFVIFNKAEETILVDLFNFDGEIEASVDISSALSLLGSIESGTSTEGGSASDSGPLTLVEKEGFLVPSDNTHWQPEDWQSDMRQTAAFASPSNIEALAGLYETELPRHGWEFIGYSLAGPEGHLYFEGNDGEEFFVNLRTEGNLTAVELVIRNPAAAAELGVVMPPSGQSRIYFGSIVDEEVTVTVDGQDFTLPPGDMADTLDDAQYVDLAAGAYTVSADIPDMSEEASEALEVDDGEVWTVLAGPGGLLVIQAY
jgi:hypothetical protein